MSFYYVTEPRLSSTYSDRHLTHQQFIPVSIHYLTNDLLFFMLTDVLDTKTEVLLTKAEVMDTKTEVMQMKALLVQIKEQRENQGKITKIVHSKCCIPNIYLLFF